MMYSKGLRTIISLNHEAYTARNEELYGAVKNVPVHFIWSKPDIEHPTKGWSAEAYYSNWEFDFKRNTPILESILTELD